MQRKTWLLTIAVLVLFALAHDFWAWRDPVPLGPFGLPRWIYVFGLLQFALAGAIYLHGRRARGEPRDDA
jgi:hypothetical protein